MGWGDPALGAVGWGDPGAGGMGGPEPWLSPPNSGGHWGLLPHWGLWSTGSREGCGAWRGLCHPVTLSPVGPSLSPGPAPSVPFRLSCSIRRRRPMALTGNSSRLCHRSLRPGGPRGTSCQASPPSPDKIRGDLRAPGRGSLGLSVLGGLCLSTKPTDLTLGRILCCKQSFGIVIPQGITAPGRAKG